MSRPIRIAAAGILLEANSFTPVPTTSGDFAVSRGLERYAPAPGAEDELDGVELIPCMIARAQPGGIVEREAYERLKAQLLAELKEELPFDGLLLDLHGAMEVAELGDGESDLLHDVRAVVGDDMPIAISLDLHANIAPEVAAGADILTAYRTAPHRDERATRRRALRLLADTIASGRRASTAMVKLPLLLTGEASVTDIEPARSLYAGLEPLARTPGLLDASLVIGCAWTDSPYATVSALVVAEADAALAQQHAARLAAAVWERRADFAYAVETAGVAEAVEAAMSSPQAPVFISDSGDNVTAGAPGDSAALLRQLLESGARDALVAGLADAPALRACVAAGEGATVRLALGGTLAPALGSAVECEARVERINTAAQSRGVRSALVRVGGTRVIVTEERQAFVERSAIAAAGVDPDEPRIVVVKLGYLFPDLEAHAARAIMALSPGATTLRLDSLPYRQLPRPIYPLEAETSWPTD